MERPSWLRLGEQMLGPLLHDASVSLRGFTGPDFHVTQLPALALYHLAHCLDSSMDANEKGRHAVALSLIRQAVEAITLIELGLCDSGFSYPPLLSWSEGRKSHGELRKELERQVWPRYGAGLWNEPWSVYFASLSKAVQPYAHCSPELLQWNLAVLTRPQSGRFMVSAGTYDAGKASRITLLHVLVVWTLGRLIFANRPPQDALVQETQIRELGSALAKSKFLLAGEDWSVQLWPHMFFQGSAPVDKSGESGG